MLCFVLISTVLFAPFMCLDHVFNMLRKIPEATNYDALWAIFVTFCARDTEINDTILTAGQNERTRELSSARNT